MDSPDRETLSALAQHLGWPSVSIHMPTHRAGNDKGQDPIRLKNLLKSAEEDLRAGELRPPEIETLLGPARALLSDGSFWRDTGDGLSIFLAEDVFHRFKVPVELIESVSVGERFAIRPLLPALQTGERFYVLALSKNRVRLLEATGDEIGELDLTGVPRSLADALKYEDYERQVTFHSRTPMSTGKGRRAAMFHGHGGIQDSEKDELSRYFHMIDKGIHEFLHDDDAPLLLSGVDYLLAMYRETNSYPHLVEASMSGNPDELTLSQIHHRGQELLKPHFRAELDQDVASLQDLIGTAEASADLHEIIRAAYEGRVRVLFVSPHANHWGRYDPSSGRVDIAEQPGPDDWDLADLAASETLLHGGVIHTIDDLVADDTSHSAAALFRY